jgi:adenylate kinase
MKIVLMGPPGAGKGTQAKLISNMYSIPHISTGDIFRKQISEKTPFGIEAKETIDKGQLAPDEITIHMVEERIGLEDCKVGFLLDGFPRTLVQAVAFESYLQNGKDKLDAVILVEVPRSEILERMTGRRVCLNCGASYHINFNPTKVEGKCDVCGMIVVQRVDDQEETVKRRLRIYDEQTQPLIKYYKEKKLLHIIDGTLDIKEVSKNICDILGSKAL